MEHYSQVFFSNGSLVLEKNNFKIPTYNEGYKLGSVEEETGLGGYVGPHKLNNNFCKILLS